MMLRVLCCVVRWGCGYFPLQDVTPAMRRWKLVPKFALMALLDSLEDFAVIIGTAHTTVALQTLLPQVRLVGRRQSRARLPVGARALLRSSVRFVVTCVVCARTGRLACHNASITHLAAIHVQQVALRCRLWHHCRCGCCCVALILAAPLGQWYVQHDTHTTHIPHTCTGVSIGVCVGVWRALTSACACPAMVGFEILLFCGNFPGALSSLYKQASLQFEVRML